MTKHIRVTGKENAFIEAGKILPGDYEYDPISSNNAGYPIYRSVDKDHFYDYICDLNTCLEINLSNGDTINIFIDPEEATNKMYEYTITIGLFDKDTEMQEISLVYAKKQIESILLDDFQIYAFTMLDCYGVYTMQSTGRIINEPSIRVEIATSEKITKINQIINSLKKRLNQETIMLKIQEADISFI